MRVMQGLTVNAELARTVRFGTPSSQHVVELSNVQTQLHSFLATFRVMP